MSARRIVIIVLLILLLMGIGCWDKRELDELAIVLGLAVDKAATPDRIKLTLQILRPGEVRMPGTGTGGGLRQPVWVVSGTGYTIGEALAHINLQTGREIYLGHSDVMVFGEVLAREGLGPYLDYFDRYHEFRRRNYFLIAYGNEGRDILQAHQLLDEESARALHKMVNTSRISSWAAAINFGDFLGIMGLPGQEVVAGRVELVDPGALLREQQGNNNGEKSVPGTTPVAQLRLTGASVFADDKLVGFLGLSETRGYKWITGSVEHTFLITPNPREAGRLITHFTRKADVQLIPRIDGEHLEMTVKVREQGDILEIQGFKDIQREDDMERLRHFKAAIIKEEMEVVLARAREWGTDIFGFGQAFRRAYPREWKTMEKDWQEIFARVEVVFMVETQIERMGLLRELVPFHR